MSDANPSAAEPTPFERARRLSAAGAAHSHIEDELRRAGVDAHGIGLVMESLARASADAEAQVDAAPLHPCPRHAGAEVLATCPRCGGFFCGQCLAEGGLAAVPESGQCAQCEARPVEARPLGGWLYVMGLNLVAVVPGRALTAWTDARGAVEYPRFAAFLTVNAVAHAAMAALALVTCVAFFARRRRAVPLTIAFAVGSLVVAVLGQVTSTWAAEQGFPAQASPLRTVGGTAVGSLAWVLYLVRSKRVAETFVR